MSTHPFTINVTPSVEDLKTIDERLDAYNVQQTKIDDSCSLGLTLHDEHGTLIGGLSGTTALGWLYIGVLWLDQAYRRQGTGSQLLGLAEDEARQRDCQNVCLSTFSFQAKSFYEKYGYKVFGQLEDYPEGETLYFMRKRLNKN